MKLNEITANKNIGFNDEMKNKNIEAKPLYIQT